MIKNISLKNPLKKQSVGLIIFTEIPNVGFVALLRERGRFNFEKMSPESWYGSYQPTVHGKLETGESFLDALYREMAEELGVDFTKYFINSIKNKDLEIVEAYNFNENNKNVVTFTSKVEPSCLKKIRLSPDGGIIRFIKKDEIDKIIDISSFDRHTGVADRDTIAMFSDDKEALIEGFKYLS